MKKLNLSAALPYALCIVLFYVLTVLFFKPEFFDNKTIAPFDIKRYEGGSKEVRDYNAIHKDVALWTGHMFGGMPVYLLHLPYPDKPVAWLDWSFKGLFFLDKSAHAFFAFMLCSFVALCCFGVSPWLAALLAAGFGLSTYNLILIEVGHLTKSWAIAYAGMVLAGIFLAYKGRLVQGFALTTLAMALELRANHLQITYYLAFICVLFVLAELYDAFRNKTLPAFAKASGVLILAVLIGVATSAGRIMTTLEYSPYTQRGKAELTPQPGSDTPDDGLSKSYAFNWSQGISESFTLLVPGFQGGSNNERLSTGSRMYRMLENAYRNGQMGADEFKANVEKAGFMYWGDQPFTSAPVYAGAVLCFLFVLGLLLIEPKYRWWLVAAFALMLFIAWGKNFQTFNYLMFDFFPGFNKFRAVTMALSLAVLLMMIGAGMGVAQLFAAVPSADLSRKVLLSAGATGGLCVLMLLFSFGMSFSSPIDGQFGELAADIRADRADMFRADALRSLVFIVLAALALLAFLKQKVKYSIAVAALAVLAIVDVWGVGRRYLHEGTFQTSIRQKEQTPTAADEFILKDKDLSYRVLRLGNPFEETNTSYFHKSVGGYFSAKLRRYQDLITYRLDPEMRQIIGALQNNRRPDFAKLPALRMLNTRYVIANESAQGVLKVNDLPGNAWFVKQLKTVNSADEEMAAIADFNPDSVAVLDVSKFKAPAQNTFSGEGSIRLTAYAPNELAYEAESTTGGFAVFSEVHYPKGWQASINGQAVDHVRVNYILRGLEIPPGKHQIVFSFRSEAYETGSLITLVSSWLVLLLVLAAIAYTIFVEPKAQG